MTATLSVEAVHVRVMVLSVFEAATTFVGTDGAVVSEVVPAGLPDLMTPFSTVDSVVDEEMT